MKDNQEYKKTGNLNKNQHKQESCHQDGKLGDPSLHPSTEINN